MKSALPLQGTHGALLLDPGKTRFSLWAPDARSVALVTADGLEHSLRRNTDGWYSAEIACGAGTRYRFRIDDDLDVPDPAARAQFDDVHGYSVVVDPHAFQWQTRDWRGMPWHKTVLYELHAGLLGGFEGIEKHLKDLAELGITAIELMPVNEFPGARNWGYDGVLPFAPDAAYGTPEQLKHLVDTAHALGLMVFLDVVYNHFGPDGNYLGQYAKGFFRDDIHTPWGAAIDFRRREVRDFFCENALMWVLDYRIDGLRLDAVHAISEKDFLVELAERVRAAVEPERHVHLVLENEDNSAKLLEQGFDAQWNDDGHNVLHVLLTGEKDGYYADFHENATAKLARCLAEGFIFQGQQSLRGHPRGEPSEHLSPNAFVLFLQNHDQIGNRAFGERLTVLSDPLALQAATALLLLSPMVPMIFMGDEWGSTQPFLFFTDHHDELAELVRDGRRNEFTHFPAFKDPKIRASIPDPNAASTFDNSRPRLDARQGPEHQAWRMYYRQLLALRHEEIIPRLPCSRSLGAEVLAEGAVSARWCLGDGSRLQIDINLSDTAVPLPRSGIKGRRLIASPSLQPQGLLPAHAAVVTLEESA
jgi:maltooligosyltrehalose trehalohydrolase